MHKKNLMDSFPIAAIKGLNHSHHQDHALVIGYGATTGVLQSVMMKPPNIVNVYPLEPDSTINPFLDSSVVTLPDEWTQFVVVFNIESDRPDDVM